MTRTGQGEESLATVLARVARRRSDGALVAIVAAGLAALALAVVLPLPGASVVALASVALAAFGAWGICDREMSERGIASARARGIRLLAILRLALALVGASCALLAVLAMLRRALGTWIS